MSFDRLAYHDPRPDPALIGLLGWLNASVLLPHVLRIERFDLPEADLERLRTVVRPGSAAFLTPNHPEFTTDWLIDKEIARRVSPLMAHWASYEIVNAHPIAQWIWLQANLIANAPGGRGRDYSLRWARMGHGVLLHPEGAPSWHGDRVGTLLPGAVEMAIETKGALEAERLDGRVWVVPIVWKIHFDGDVSKALIAEIEHIEKGLGIARTRNPRGVPLERRFADLQKAILARSLAHESGATGGRALIASDIKDGEFFALQDAHAMRMLEGLEARHGKGDGDLRRRAHALRRAIATARSTEPDAMRREKRRLLEVERLHQFTAEHYGSATLTQEQIAESVKALRLAVHTSGMREGLHGVLPVAVAKRTVRVRVPEPIAIETFGPPVAEVVATLRARLQGALDGVNREIAPLVDPWRRPNPLAS